jgi:dethiobiotin synthase
MRRGVFVTGTDTGVGKTVVAAALLHRYRGAGPLRYWKPIQTGIEQDDDTADVRRLGACTPDEILDDGVRLSRPVSPHLAAKWTGRRIGIAGLTALADAHEASRLVVEGAGGVLVPINDSQTIADLIVALDLPAVVVARSTLGTINHTLLTIEALRARGVVVVGVVMAGPPNADNREAIERAGRTTVLGELPPIEPLSPDGLAAWARAGLDPTGAILEYLG